MESQIRSRVEFIIKDIPRKACYTCFIDRNKNGRFRMKFAYLHEGVTNEQINKIRKLSPYIVKVENIVSERKGYGFYNSLTVHTTIAPRYIVCRKNVLFS